jgi:hypothetical protein
MKDLIEMIAEGLEPASDEEIEKARGETLQQLKESSEEDQPWDDIEAQHQPGAPGFHSALHTIQLYMDNIERHVLANPAVVLDPDTYRAAYRAYEALGETFQELASIALERAMGEIDQEEAGGQGKARRS